MARSSPPYRTAFAQCVKRGGSFFQCHEHARRTAGRKRKPWLFCPCGKKRVVVCRSR